MTKPNDGLPPSWSLRNTAWPSSATTRTASGPPPAIEVRSAPAARMNGLPVTPIATTSSSARAASIASFSDEQAARPEGVGLGVVLAVVQGDQAEHAGAWPFLADRVTLRSLASVTRSASEEISRARASRALDGGHAAAPFQFGFSQITVPPMPMPMHMVVRP